VTSGAARRVSIIGAGIAGAACAVALRESGVAVQVIERGRAPGGRLASPELHGRRVDLGAGYFTVRDSTFAAVVDGWQAAGLARPWTDTFDVLAPGKPATRTSGPQRWATPHGTRSLVRQLLEGVEVVLADTVLRLPEGDVVLAMPDPQAALLTAVPEPVGYEPAIAVACGFTTRDWSLVDAAFIHDHPDLAFVADDGARRGDGAAVLVAHSTPELARRHLQEPEGAVGPVLTALTELLDVGPPAWTHSHRWRYAKPATRHDASFGLLAADGRRIGLAGDQWCPDGTPRVESAWRSGTELGRVLAAGG
jgi:renalase